LFLFLAPPWVFVADVRKVFFRTVLWLSASFALFEAWLISFPLLLPSLYNSVFIPLNECFCLFSNPPSPTIRETRLPFLSPYTFLVFLRKLRMMLVVLMRSGCVFSSVSLLKDGLLFGQDLHRPPPFLAWAPYFYRLSRLLRRHLFPFATSS